MSQRRVNETSLTATADALRAKLGTSDPIPWVEGEGFKEAVESIQTDSGGADVSGVTATETEVLEGAIFVDAHGEYKEGTIHRNGDTSATFDGIETKSVEIPAGYTTGGTVALDGTIDNAVEAAKTSIANKGVEVPTDTDVRGLAGLIDSIPEATEPNLGEKVITENGSYSASDEGLDGYSKVEVNVPESPGGGGGSGGGSTTIAVENVINLHTEVEVESAVIPNLISPDMRTWSKNSPAMNAFHSIEYDEPSKSNHCLYNGVGMFEFIGVPMTLEAGKRYTFSIDYYSPYTLTGDYAEPYAPYIGFFPEGVLATNADSYSENYAVTQLALSVASYTTYSVTYTPSSTVNGCVAFGMGSTTDGVLVELYIKNAKLLQR